jgi:DNA-binding response OmpR family regulator
MSKETVLIVEDDLNILRANTAALELEGYRVHTAVTLDEARSVSKAYPPDLILLDVLLPDGNGLDYCGELRGESGVRILFLSALGTKADVLAGLRAGGDDYIAKPYDMDELILRVKALLRRGRMLGRAEPPLTLGKLTLDRTSRRAFLSGRDILLKPKEFAVLSLLAESRGRTVPAKELYEKVWGMRLIGDMRTVKEHISRIRGKLGKESAVYIVSERGKGYRLEF